MGKEVYNGDECSKCSEVLQCSLSKMAHRFDATHSIKAEMNACQMDHIEKRWKEEGQKSGR